MWPVPCMAASVTSPDPALREPRRHGVIARCGQCDPASGGGTTGRPPVWTRPRRDVTVWTLIVSAGLPTQLPGGPTQHVTVTRGPLHVEAGVPHDRQDR